MRAINSPNARAGNAMILALVTVTVLASFAASALRLTATNSSFAFRQGKLNKAQIAADGALESYYAQWKKAAATNSSRALNTTQLAALTTPTTNLHSGFSNDQISFSNQAIELCDPWGSPVEAANPNGYTSIAKLPNLGFLVNNVTNYPGMVGLTTFYRAKVRASLPKSVGMSKPTTSEVRRYFEMTNVSIFQFMVFFEEDIEIHPGDDMTITGKLHTNSDAWSKAYTYVKIFDKFSYAGTYADDLSPERKKIGGSLPSKYVTWADNKTSPTSTSKPQQLSKVNRIEIFGDAPVMTFNAADASPNNDSFSELIEVPDSKWDPTGNKFLYNQPASAATNKPEIEARRLYNNADVVIKIDSSKPTTDASRVTVSGPNLTAGGISAIKAAVGSTVSLYDFREAKSAPVTAIDMKRLTAAAASSSSFTAGNSFNGVAYVYDSRTGKNAIRLQNGAELDTDITVASEDPVYVQGDYNTGGGYNDAAAGKTHNVNAVPSNASGNTAGTDSTFATGYTPKSSAIVGDAVMVLSNSWNDANASKSIGNRKASHTTVNAAFVAGYVPTDYKNNNAPGGGIHNLQRFLEDWDGKSFSFNGSMIQTTVSQQWTGLWDSGSVYNPPDRHWSYDYRFLSRPPPGGIAAVLYSRGRWQRENSTQ